MAAADRFNATVMSGDRAGQDDDDIKTGQKVVKQCNISDKLASGLIIRTTTDSRGCQCPEVMTQEPAIDAADNLVERGKSRGTSCENMVVTAAMALE